jgi:hypothetical protein
MARPKKDDALGASAFIGLRVPPAMRAALEKRAETNGTTLATEARASIERDLKGKRKP